MNISDLQSLDFKDAANWNLTVKSIFSVFVLITVLTAGWFFVIQPELVGLDDVRAKEVQLREEFIEKQSIAINLGDYTQQMEEMKQRFGEMLQQLPGKTEIAGLLIDVSQAGVSSGLEFDLFKPEPEMHANDYAQLPIRIGVAGDYHQFGSFVGGVAALSRIVTLHDIVIRKTKGGILSMEATAKTYRYLEDEKSTNKKKGSK